MSRYRNVTIWARVQGASGANVVALVPAGDAFRNCPLDSCCIVSVCCHIIERAAAGNCRGTVRTMQERHGLSAGHGSIGRKGRGAGAARNAFFNRPQDGIVIYAVSLHIG